MGNLAVETIERLKTSNELRFQAGVVSMDDTRVKMLEDSLTRIEMEFVGIDSTQFSVDDILGDTIKVKEGESLDDASRFTQRQLEDFDREVKEVEYGDIDYLKWLPVTSVPIGAQKHTFFLGDMQGSYKRITGSAMDLPVSHISGEEHSIKIEMGGGSIDWNQQEMDAATFAGVPLEIEKVRSVRRAYLENIASLIVYGNDNLIGFDTSLITEAALADSVANPNSVSSTALKYWVNKIGREVVADIASMRRAISNATLGRWGGPAIDTGVAGSTSSFTLITPLESINYLFDLYMHTTAGGTNTTAWAFLNSPEGKLATGVTQYRVIHAFDAMFNSNTVPGIMMVPNDPAAFSFVRPKDLTPMPVQFRGLSMVIPYYDYFGGMKLIRDKALLKRYNVEAA
ncbi:DUF2184 domain-containing protein [bacterium]|nr:DUF2184 domain-containing protein [bacterium]